MDTITTPTTDIVVLDDVAGLNDSDNEGSSNAAIGAVCLAAGVAIGTFVVPPVVGFVKSWFTSSSTTEEKVEEIMATTTPAKEKKAV